MNGTVGLWLARSTRLVAPPGTHQASAVNDIVTGFAVVALTLRPDLGQRWLEARRAARA